MSRITSRIETEERRQEFSNSKGGGGAIDDYSKNGISTPLHHAACSSLSASPIKDHAIGLPSQLPAGKSPLNNQPLLEQLAIYTNQLHHLTQVHKYTSQYLPKLSMLDEVSLQISQIQAKMALIHNQLGIKE